jgi:hypothetical protein
MNEMNKKSGMRSPVQNIYDRQVAKCLGDISEVYSLPSVVVDRIKKAIEWTAKDVDKINNKESDNGYQHANYNR